MGDELEVQVFGFWASPYSGRVELALKLKGVQYSYVEEDVVNKKSDLLLKYNPIYKKVPVLLHHGQPIAESLVILEYIDEYWGSNNHCPLLPKDCHERALARFWAAYIDGKVTSAVHKAAKSKGEEREKAVEEVQEALAPLENELKGNKFFGGHTIGFLDIVAIVVAYWFPAIEEALGIELIATHKFPNLRLRLWCQELSNHTLVKEVLPQRDVLVAYLKAIFQKN